MIDEGVGLTFVGVEAVEKAQEFALVGTQYAVDIGRLVLVGYEELQDGRVEKVSTHIRLQKSRGFCERYQGIELKP